MDKITVTQAAREAAMLREISTSEARGIDWSVNLNASAEFLESVAHRLASQTDAQMAAPDGLAKRLKAVFDTGDSLDIADWFYADAPAVLASLSASNAMRDALERAAKYQGGHQTDDGSNAWGLGYEAAIEAVRAALSTQGTTLDRQTVDALAVPCELYNGPDGRGGRKVSVHFPNVGDDEALWSLLNASHAQSRASLDNPNEG